MGCHEVILVYRERWFVVLCQEIIAIAGIRITLADKCLCRLPCNGSNRIKEPLTINHANRHFFQVIGLHQIVASEAFRLQGTAIAIDLHLRGIRETGFLEECVCQFINATLRDTYLRPHALLQYGMVCITCFNPTYPCMASDSVPGCCLYIQLETDKLQILAIAEHQRHQRHVEHALFPCHANVLCNDR